MDNNTYLQWNISYYNRRSPEEVNTITIHGRDLAEAFKMFYGKFEEQYGIVIVDAQQYYTGYCCIIIYRDDRDGDVTYEYNFDTPSELFNYVSYMYAFDDIDDYEIAHIFCDDQIVHYTGWRPGMRFVYTNLRDEVVWDQCYMQWDH